jgi:hypothetical protein
MELSLFYGKTTVITIQEPEVTALSRSGSRYIPQSELSLSCLASNLDFILNDTSVLFPY